MHLRSVPLLACVLSAVLLAAESVRVPVGDRDPRALPGPKDVLYAAPYEANYAYGPRGAELGALRANATAAASSTWGVRWDDAFLANLPAKTAFQAAVDIWANIISSPVPIRVDATFGPLGTGVLGSAGPTALCTTGAGLPDTLYAAALADKLAGTPFCANTLPVTDPMRGRYEIAARFNGNFADWDFGTSGTGVPGKYNFMTVVLHELGHGLGFYGSFRSSGGIGSMLNTIPDIYDRFAVTGAGAALLSLAIPSATLGMQLVSNNTFFNGSNAKAANGNQNARLETHDFAFYGFPGTNVFVPGSSYSHLDDVEYSSSPNGLQTWQLASNEVYTDPGPVMRGVLQDLGWAFSNTVCPYTLSARSTNAPAAGGTASVTVTAGTGCAWTAVSNSAFVTITEGANGSGNGTVTYSVAANGPTQRTLTLTIAQTTFSIVQAGTDTAPTMSLDKASLQFAATSNGAAFVQQTSAQTVRLLQSGPGTVTWTATPNVPWITVTPANGTGAATLEIGVKFDQSVAGVGTSIGAVTLVLTGASNSAGPINVGLATIANGGSTGPFGSFDSPNDHATGVTGSIAVSGWALDDVGIVSVKVYRDPVTGEGSDLVFIGDGVFVEGARPDVAAIFPSLPRSSQAGWGYLMLTNFLPNQGTGTYRLTVIATDVEGRTTTLGVRTITCANATSIRPFGAIDRPRQGEVVSGPSFPNYGWALARGDIGAAPPDGGTVTAFVDGAPIGSPAGWTPRDDLTAFFPAGTYPNVGHSNAVIGLNTTAMTNGVHTIFWIVTASNLEQDGIGSRFFSVANSNLMADPTDSQSLRLDAPPLLVPERRSSRLSLVDEVNAAPLEGEATSGRRGFNLRAPLQSYAVTGGRATVRGEELDRIELQLGAAGYTGYQRVGAGLGPLPIGSRLDEETGTFTWGVGVGFLYDYDLVFVRWVDGRAVGRREIRITLARKHSGLVGTQVTIDTPAADATVDHAFLIGGWAADLDETAGTGVDTLHVWAYPRSTCHGATCDTCDGARCDAIFLGATAYGGERADVVAIFGDQFRKSGYGLIVDSLPAGTYDLAVFAWSTVKGGFVPAKVVRVTVKAPR
jgi:hypothetical protein